MMRILFAVVGKELLETLRDRRTLVSALCFGPLFGPVLFAVMITLTLDRALGDLERPLELAISGSARAPNLIAFLERNRLEHTEHPLDETAARAAIASGQARIVLVVEPGFESAWLNGTPAPLSLIYDGADTAIARDVARLRAVLGAYGSRYAALRLQIRGVDPVLAAPLSIRDLDVATPAGRSVLLLGMVTYFILFSTLMGGLHLAIDSTAGERERGSLEALLSLPLPREVLLLGKMIATCCFMVLALAITLAAFALSLVWVPLGDLGMASHFDAPTACRVFAVVLPFVPLGAALMTLVASFTRSYKEAQTWLTAILLIPTLPILFASLYGLRPSTSLMLVPSLSQHLLITSLIKGDLPAHVDLATSAVASLALGFVLGALAMRLYRRESILG
jgi:sodium transport system permease protein